MNTTSNQATDSNGSISKTKTMTKQAQIDKSSETKSFTVRTGGRKLTYVFRPRKRLSILLKFLIGIFGGQVLIWPGMAAAQGLAPNALPTGGSIGAGAASVNTVGNAMSVNQTSSKVIINWSTYNIGTEASVTYNQPSASSVALNQVTTSDPSQILGRLSSNGQVWIQNAGGVYFGKDATIDVGGLLATSLKVDNNAFMSGNTISMEKDGTAGAVINDGKITVKNGGYVALIAPSVSNTGVINAPMGTVRMAAGDKVTVDLAGDGLIKLNIDRASAQAVVTNSGMIGANGGTVVLSARSAGDLASLVVNNTGIIQANSLVERNGRIFLDGGSTGITENSGSLIARGEAAGTTGGQVQMAGNRVGVVGTGIVDVSGQVGGGQVLIGGNYQGQNTVSIIDGTAVANAQVAVVTSGASIMANSGSKGDGGKVIVWADNSTTFGGNVSARGGASAGNGGFVETSGKQTLVVQSTAKVDTGAAKGAAGTWLLDPTDITINNGGADVNVSGATPYTPAAIGASSIQWSTIKTALGTGNVEVTTAGSPATAGNVGDITIGAASGDLTSANNLALTAAGNVLVNNAISNSTANGSLTMKAANNIAVGAAINFAGAVTGSANDSAGGTVSGTGSISVGSGGSVTTTDAAGNIVLTVASGTGGVTMAGGTTLSTRGAAITIAGSGVTIGDGGTTATVQSNAGGVTTGGAISINGGVGKAQYGVSLNKAVVNSSASTMGGAITIIGTGATGAVVDSFGVNVDASSSVDSGAGNLNITGVGGTSSQTTSRGLVIQNNYR